MPKSYAEAQPPLSERLPIVTYTNSFQETAETVWMSPQVERLFGYRLEEWVGKPGFFETVALHPDDRGPVLAEMHASREELRPFSRDYRLVGRDGRVVWVHDESVPIVNEDGRPEFIQGYFIDITERKELERQLLQSQKTEALGRMAAGIAHDFNNLLTAIGGYAEFAKRSIGPDSPAWRPVGEITATVERATKLTRQLLSFSRREELDDAQTVCLTDLIRDSESMLLHVAGHAVQLDLELGDTSKVTADPGQLEQVLMNLVSNARDAGASRVAIRTTTATVTHGNDSRRLGVAPGDYVALVVSDTGSGMDEEVQARVFDPFFTTKHRDGGTGLGLSLAHSVIRQCGGAIEVASALGSGTTFRILLPVANVG
jgi:two-component system, cell cycle sensor histidine kinase and response regulator CckA